jgi:methylisocitrate lyase
MRSAGREEQSNQMAATLRRMIRRESLMLPGAFNGATARLIERAGFGGVYASGAGMCNATAGVPDIGLLSLEEVANLAGYIAAAVKIPVIADADTGFDDPGRTVKLFRGAGLGGLHIEDQEFPKRCGHLGGKTVVKTAEMTSRIRTAVKARRGEDFLIIARTDARAVEGFDAAVARAKEYLAAGADAIFPEALETAKEFAEFAWQVGGILMANMTEFGRGPLLSARQLAAMGYRLVIYPQTAFRVAMKSEELCLKDLKKSGSQKKWLTKMQTRRELYDLLEYDPNSEIWPKGNNHGRGKR